MGGHDRPHLIAGTFRLTGPAAPKGVRVINLAKDDTLADVARIVDDEDADGESDVVETGETETAS